MKSSARLLIIIVALLSLGVALTPASLIDDLVYDCHRAQRPEARLICRFILTGNQRTRAEFFGRDSRSSDGDSGQKQTAPTTTTNPTKARTLADLLAETKEYSTNQRELTPAEEAYLIGSGSNWMNKYTDDNMGGISRFQPMRG